MVDEVLDMKHLGLFEGIGGFSLAARWMGWETVAWCEINEFCQKVLKHHFPEAEGHSDIITTDFTKYAGRIDIVTGGFPCQPYSQAGKRKGKADDRHLWPQMLRAIIEIQPTWVVGENVPGLLNWQRGMALAEIYADLETAGFEVFPPVILPACGKNAPHRRDRLWVVANSKINSCGYDIRNEGSQSQEISEKRFDELITTTNPTSIRLEREAENGKLGRGQRFVFSSTAGEQQWENFPTESPILGINDGIPDRVDRIKALGNAIVPQVAYEIFKAIATL